MSDYVATFQIYNVDMDGKEDTAALEMRVAKIDKIAPMAKKRDRTDETNATFLKNAVMSRSWGVNALASLKGKEYSYQEPIDALFGSISDQSVHS